MDLGDSERVVIVGAGHAGGRMAQHLRQAGFGGAIALVGDEPELPYERPALSKEILHGTKSPADLRLQDHDRWVEAGVELMLASPVAQLDVRGREVRLADGRALSFDRLILASGGGPRRLAVPGADDPRVVTLRTMADGLALARLLPAIRRLVVIGGGVIGLEVAAAARKYGVAVTVLEAGPRLMARIGPPALSAWLLDQHRAAGVDLRLGAVTTAVERGAMLRVQGRDAGGEFALDADLVLCSIGIVPSIDYLDGTGLDLGNGVRVDDRCEVTGLPIYAVGDLANTYNRLYGGHVRLETWRNAEHQPKALAEMLRGRSEPYVEVPWMWTDQYDRNIQVVGLWDDGAQVILRGEPGQKGSSCLFVRDHVVTGGVLWDHGRDRRFLEKLVADRRPQDLRQLADDTVALRTLA